MDNYFLFHLHSDFSNPTTTMDSVTKVEQYVERAKECGMTALAFTEHGNVFEWTHKKREINKAGMKYIHGVEAYVTETLDEKIRDNYHFCLLAKNYEGVKEINHLMSAKVASNREDNHFYYNPRISYKELKNTSDNVIISTACLGGLLNKASVELQADFLKFAIENKDRVFLEIQHHNVEDQIKYNKKMHKLSEEYGLNLVAGTDTHSLDEEHAEGRVVLQRAKKIYFESEEGWDLTFKTYDELLESYKEQNSLPMDIVRQAIANTKVIENMVEDFDLDRGHKYPKRHKDPEKVLNEKIFKGLEERGISVEEKISNRILHEVKGYIQAGAVNYILLEEDIKSWCRKKGIYYGYSRGSVSGSYLAYLLKVTEMDSIKHNLVFERFLNPERVTIADIDTDFVPSRRDDVKDYIYSLDGVHCADIITFNKIATKGAVRDVGRALNIDLTTVGNISNNLESKEDELRKEYPELFKFVDLLSGTIVSVGSHPAGVVVSPITLDDNISTYVLKNGGNPVVQVDMDQIEYLNFVKLDILGLDTVEVLSKTSNLAGIEPPTPETIDINDKDVWNSMKESTVGVFQWEKQWTQDYYNVMYSDETLNKIKAEGLDIDYMDLFIMGNAAIRPVGDSYRDDLARGVVVKHGNKALDDFLENRLGYLIFQEDLLKFFNVFCGFSLGEADIVRREFTKVGGDTEQFIPRIKDGFIKTMVSEHNMTKSDAEVVIEDFIQTIIDASGYLFSVNHSTSYAYIGYVNAWLRYHYPLEFLTASFEVFEDKPEKTTSLFQYMNDFTNITMNPIQFRRSRAGYNMDKETNSIYKGMASIKYLNSKMSEEIYELRDNNYDSFVELLVDIVEKTTCNTRQQRVLIELDFFKEFGNISKLLAIYDEFHNGKNKYLKTYVDKTKETRIELLKEFEANLEYKKATPIDLIKSQIEYIGYAEYTSKSYPPSYGVVTDIDSNRYGTGFITLYKPFDGEVEVVKVYKSVMAKSNIKDFDLIDIKNSEMKNKVYKNDEGEWVDLPEKEKIMYSFEIIKSD